MNTVTVKGRLGRDPELRYGADGRPRLSMRVADGYKPKNGGEEETIWWGVTIFGEEAEAGADSLRKGNRVTVVGRVRLREYADKATGQPRVAPEVQFAKVHLDEEPPHQTAPDPDPLDGLDF